MKYFQIVDNKNGCLGYFYDGAFIKDVELPVDATRTWEFNEGLEGRRVDIASIYCQNRRITEFLTKEEAQLWNLCKEREQAQLRTFETCEIDLQENCFYDLVPINLIEDICTLKDSATQKVFEQYPRPLNYNFMLDVHRLTSYLATVKLRFNKKVFQDVDLAGIFSRNTLSFNPYGTITGRFTNSPNSFPILVLKKDYRKYIKPNNNYILELDYNAAEIRTALGLSGIEQPIGDIYQWLNEEIYQGKKTRDEVKKSMISWLYNHKNKGDEFKTFLDKDALLERYYFNGAVITPFNRRIECDEAHAISYLVQSTNSDIMHKVSVEIMDLLSPYKSKLYFVIHDSIVIDLHKDDEEIMDIVIEKFQNTMFGVYDSKVSIGTNFGTLRTIK